MLKVVVVDYGGVLFSTSKSIYETLLHKYGYDPEKIRSVIKSDQRLDALKGNISDEEFWAWGKEQLPNEYDFKKIRQDYYDSFVLDKTVFDLITKLKVCFSIIAFSGNMRTRVDYLDQKYDIRRIFDKEVFSFDCGYTKPEKEFVQKMIAVAGCLPEEIVYIDDSEEAAQAAEDVGVKAVIYEKGKIDRLVKDLVVLGISI